MSKTLACHCRLIKSVLPQFHAHAGKVMSGLDLVISCIGGKDTSMPTSIVEVDVLLSSWSFCSQPVDQLRLRNIALHFPLCSSMKARDASG